jgi:hypothetical protein
MALATAESRLRAAVINYGSRRMTPGRAAFFARSLKGK